MCVRMDCKGHIRSDSKERGDWVQPVPADQTDVCASRRRRQDMRI